MERSHTLSVISRQITNVQATTLHKIPTGTVNCLLFPNNERLNHDRTLYVCAYHGPQTLLVNEIHTHAQHPPCNIKFPDFSTGDLIADTRQATGFTKLFFVSDKNSHLSLTKATL